MCKRLMYGFCLILSFVIFFSGCNNKEEADPLEFMSINGTDVMQEEYTLYLYETIRSFEEIGGQDIWDTDFDGRSAMEVARESALNSMIAVKITVLEAQRTGTALSQSQKEQALRDSQLQIEAYEKSGIEIGDEFRNAVNVIMEERLIYSIMREELVKNYSISEDEYKEYSENYFDETAMQMRQMTIKVIVCLTKEMADEAYERILAGEDYNLIFDEYNESEDAEETEFTIYQNDLEMGFRQVVESQAGYVTKPVDYEDGSWGIMKVLEINESSQAEVNEKLRLDYTNTKRQQIFSQILEKWIESSTIEINNEAMNDLVLGFQKK